MATAEGRYIQKRPILRRTEKLPGKRLHFFIAPYKNPYKNESWKTVKGQSERNPLYLGLIATIPRLPLSLDVREDDLTVRAWVWWCVAERYCVRAMIRLAWRGVSALFTRDACGWGGEEGSKKRAIGNK